MAPSPYTSEMRDAAITARKHDATEMRSARIGDAGTYWEKHAPNPEFVYFVQAIDDDTEYAGAVKIGYASDPYARLGELQTGNPNRLAIRALVLGSRPAERWYHDHWNAYRVLGEWFGAGLEHYIVALAQETSRRQIQLHQDGTQDLAWIAREVHAWVADAAQMERWHAAA